MPKAYSAFSQSSILIIYFTYNSSVFTVMWLLWDFALSSTILYNTFVVLVSFLPLLTKLISFLHLLWKISLDLPEWWPTLKTVSKFDGFVLLQSVTRNKAIGDNYNPIKPNFQTFSTIFPFLLWFLFFSYLLCKINTFIDYFVLAHTDW